MGAVAMQENFLLDGRFAINLKPKPIYAVSVTLSAVTYRAIASSSSSRSSTSDAAVGGDPSAEQSTPSPSPSSSSSSWSSSSPPLGSSIAISDTVGCDCMRGKKESDSVAAYFVIYSYTRSKKSTKSCRKRETLTLRFDHCPTYDENQEEAQRWKAVITSLIYRRQMPSVAVAFAPPQKKLLVFVNPFSGPGKALLIFQQEVIPLFAEAGLLYHLFVTEYAGHAREMVRDMKLDDWHGIVIVSGDGLIFEVVNGLMERSDWVKAIKMPLSTIPGGSGNALACAVCHHSGESYLKKHVLHSSFIVAKGEVIPMDLVAIDTCTGKRLYSFLSIGWGMMADVDIESEKYRHMGNARFAVMAVMKLASMKKYRGRLSYLPCEGERCRGNSLPRYTKKEKEVDDQPGVEKTKNNFACHHASAAIGAAGDDVGAPTPLLVPLSEPVPSSWVTVEDDFIMVGAVYQSHLAKDNMMAPNATLNDGIIHLVVAKGNITRLRLAHIFATLEHGFQTSDENMEIIRVQAFRLEPLTPKGLMTVDGEVVDYGPIQAQVLPSMARIVALNKNCDAFT